MPSLVGSEMCIRDSPCKDHPCKDHPCKDHACNLAKITPARITPARIHHHPCNLARITPARISPARIHPASVHPARITSDSTRPQRCSTAPPANDLFLERMSCKMALGQVTCKMCVAVILPQRQSDLYEAWKLNALKLKVSTGGRKLSAFGFPSLPAIFSPRSIRRTSSSSHRGRNQRRAPSRSRSRRVAFERDATRTRPRRKVASVARLEFKSLACKHVGRHIYHTSELLAHGISRAIAPAVLP